MSWQEELWFKSRGQKMQKISDLLDEGKCSCCGSFFLKKALDEESRCTVCAKRGLTAGGFKEEFDKIKSPEQQREELKVLIKEILRELKEEEKEEKQAKAYKPKPCKKCKTVFTPRSAAHCVCDDCQEEERKNKK